MQHNWTIARRRCAASALAGITAAIVFGCAEPASPADQADASSPRGFAGREVAGVGDLLAQLRSATARFHEDTLAARNAGYTVQLTGCMTDPTRGGMGFHYGNPSLIDATVNVREPEVLLYEPEKNGRYRLVGVEFIIPYTIRPRGATPPSLFGQDFKQNDIFQLWALHAWVWRNNPSGTFADWNPEVNCDAAPAAARMSHSSR